MAEPNPFVLFALPERPEIDAALLQSRFLELAARLHPDVNPAPDAAVQFQRVVTAHRVLQDPVQRLEALLEVCDPLGQTPRKPQSLKGDLPDLFLRISALQQQVSTHLLKHSSALSPIGRALLKSESIQLAATLEKTLLHLRERCTALNERIRSIDQNWDAQNDLPGLCKILGELTYLQKWRAQVRESLVRMNQAWEEAEKTKSEEVLSQPGKQILP